MIFMKIILKNYLLNHFHLELIKAFNYIKFQLNSFKKSTLFSINKKFKLLIDKLLKFYKLHSSKHLSFFS
jgi:hypothetical protein